MKKHVKIILMVVVLIILGASGYFLCEHLGVFAKRQTSITQPANSVAELAEEGAISSQPLTANMPEENVLNNPTDEASKSQDEKTANNQSTTASNQQQLSTGSAKKVDNADEEKNEDTKIEPGKIVSKLVPWGFQKSSGRSIKAVIVHTSYNALGGDKFDFDKVMQEWKDAGVAPHYAIDRDGTIYQLVADQNIAWHAGASKLPDGTADVNGVSIGVEVINTQDAKFADAQYSALNSLIATLQKKYNIKYVLGHEDIAPGRKTDPWNIDWGKVTK